MYKSFHCKDMVVVKQIYYSEFLKVAINKKERRFTIYGKIKIKRGESRERKDELSWKSIKC